MINVDKLLHCRGCQKALKCCTRASLGGLKSASFSHFEINALAKAQQS